MLTRGDERGTILVLTAALLVVFLGLAALAVDAAMAWSNRRSAQGIADTSVMAALQEVPGAIGDAAAIAAAESFAATNNAANATDVAVTRVEVIPQPGQVDVEIDVAVNSATPFGRAIGAGDSFAITANAEGRIEVFLPGVSYPGRPATMRLLPLGVSGTTARLLCSSTGPCPMGLPSSGYEVIGMRRVDTLCTDADETTTRNLEFGVEHLIGFDSALRDEREACEARAAGGHQVALPTTSRLVSSSRIPYSGFATLLGGDPLWEYLIDGLPGSCDKDGYDPAAPIDDLTTRMRSCLDSGTRPLFDGSLGIHDPRLGWGVFHQAGGSDVRYVGPAIFWVHSVIGAAGQTTNPTGGSFTGAVVFRLEPDMLPPGYADVVPVARNGLEFTLVE